MLASLAVLTVLLGAVAGLAIHLIQSGSSPGTAVIASRHGFDGEATWAPGTHRAPPITTLRDQTGHIFSLASLRGRTVEIVFFDSHCRQQCPLEGRALAAAERSLPASERPVLVVVSVNPADTPTSVGGALRAWGLAGLAPWHWLMGPRRHLAPVWGAYRIYVSPHPINGDIAHTEAVYLVDRGGYERSAYIYPFATRFVTHDLRALARTRSA